MNTRLAHGLAVGLSALAGFVDAMGYLALGGVFVSFMSGNSTVLGAAGAAELGNRAWLAVGLVLAFTLGVMVGTFAGRPFGPRRAPAILLLVAVFLAAAVLLHTFGFTIASGTVVALAMGTENTVFQKDGQAGMGLTYMTGTLVRLGQRAAEACLGGPWAALVPDVLLWGGMVVGAYFGALVFGRIGLDGLWIAVLLVLVMAAIAKTALRQAGLRQGSASPARPAVR